ncbi:Hypp7015 [Branchiostoma lanceolatum]|uniref:Hypp7015 protein n=1 Tax=Branchiostoma lanceolatum TaxID=7740 RepID=A0A8J9YWL1_BRALA|nr:Hypp7015 [Branchiostoma lanceolatum]
MESYSSSTEEKKTPPGRNKKTKFFRLLVYHRLGVLTLPEKKDLQELLEEERKKDLTRGASEQSTSKEELEPPSQTTKIDKLEEWELSAAGQSWGDCMIDSHVGRQEDAQKHDVNVAWDDGDKGDALPSSQMDPKLVEELLLYQNHREDAWKRLREFESTSSEDELYDGETLMFWGHQLRYTSEQISVENLPTFQDDTEHG